MPRAARAAQQSQRIRSAALAKRPRSAVGGPGTVKTSSGTGVQRQARESFSRQSSFPDMPTSRLPTARISRPPDHPHQPTLHISQPPDHPPSADPPHQPTSRPSLSTDRHPAFRVIAGDPSPNGASGTSRDNHLRTRPSAGQPDGAPTPTTRTRTSTGQTNGGTDRLQHEPATTRSTNSTSCRDSPPGTGKGTQMTTVFALSSAQPPTPSHPTVTTTTGR